MPASHPERGRALTLVMALAAVSAFLPFGAAASAAPPEPVAKAVAPVLRAQGGWYTPLTRPGMPAPYDINDYHKQSAAKPAPAGSDRRR